MTKSQKDKKEDINLIKRLSSKLTFIESEKLIQTIMNKEIEEQKNLSQYQNITSLNTIENNNSIKRNLKEDILEGSLGFTRDILYTNILGQDASLKYRVCLDGGKLKNYLIFNFGWLSFEIGNVKGMDKTKKKGSDKRDELPLAKIPLGPLPVKLSLKLGSSIDFSFYAPENIIITLDCSGSLYVKAGLEFGLGNVATIEAGVKGDFITLKFFSSFKKNYYNIFEKDNISLKATAGTLKAYAIAKVWIWTVFSGEFEILKGFPVAEITF